MGILPASPAAAADATYSLYRSLGTPRVVVVVVVVTGTGGSISIRHGNRLFMTPSGVPCTQRPGPAGSSVHAACTAPAPACRPPHMPP